MAGKTRTMTRKHREAISRGVKAYHNRCRLCAKRTQKKITSAEKLRKMARDKRIAEIARNQALRKSKFKL